MISIFTNRRPNNSSRRSSRPTRRLIVEPLEHRQLLAVDGFATVAEGAWTFDPSNSMSIEFGEAGDVFVAGDWLGAGQDYRTVVRPNASGELQWTATDGVSEVSAIFGKAGDTPVVGDWNGDGVDNMGFVRRGPHGFMEWHLDLDLDKDAELVLHYGLNTDIPVVGNWDDDPGDEIGVVRHWGDGILTWLIDTDGDPTEEITYKFGLPGDIPVVGDWDDDGRDNLGVVRSTDAGAHRWYLGTNTDATEDIVFDFGRAGDTPLAGQFVFPRIAVGYQINDVPYYEIQSNPSYDLNLSRAYRLGWLEESADFQLAKAIEIRNDGDVPLHLSDIRIVQGPAANDSYTRFEILSSPEWIAPGAVDTIVISVDGRASEQWGHFSEAFLVFDTNDISADPFVIHVYASEAGDPSAPEITVSHQGQRVLDGLSSLHFRKDPGSPRNKVVTVKNTGTKDLVITGINSSNPELFQVTGRRSFTLGSNQSRTFSVKMVASEPGRHEATITINNNDTNEGHFDFRVVGELSNRAVELAPALHALVDVNADGSATALDALIIINVLNSPSPPGQSDRRADVNEDGLVTPLDALLVINHLNTADSRAIEHVPLLTLGSTSRDSSKEATADRTSRQTQPLTPVSISQPIGDAAAVYGVEGAVTPASQEKVDDFWAEFGSLQEIATDLLRF